MTERKIIEVCAGVAIHEGRLLLATRRPGGALAGLWEFPGGKCDAGETLEQCIVRELHEELGAEVTSACEMLSLVYEYPEKTVRLHFMQCRLGGDIQGLKGLEGQDVGWHHAEELCNLTFAPADLLFLHIVNGTAETSPQASWSIMDEASVNTLKAWLGSAVL